MIKIVVNPGTEPCVDTTTENATENMMHFVTDCKQKDLRFVRIPELDYGEGRYAFLIWQKTVCHEIQMPGLTLDKVRYMGGEQNIWHYPRLYIDGSSRAWIHAILDKKEDWETEKE